VPPGTEFPPPERRDPREATPNAVGAAPVGAPPLIEAAGAGDTTGTPCGTGPLYGAYVGGNPAKRPPPKMEGAAENEAPPPKSEVPPEDEGTPPPKSEVVVDEDPPPKDEVGGAIALPLPKGEGDATVALPNTAPTDAGGAEVAPLVEAEIRPIPCVDGGRMGAEAD